MSSMEVVKKRIYEVPASNVLDLLTTFYVDIEAKGGDGLLDSEAKLTEVADDLYQTKDVQMEMSRRVKRNIHEMVLLTKANRAWWLLSPLDASKIYWRIDHFLNTERFGSFGAVNHGRLGDYKTLGVIADKMLDVMDHYSRAMSVKTFDVEIPINREALESLVDDFIGDFSFNTVEPLAHEVLPEVRTYRNPFAVELMKANIDIHDVFRI
jgi:hypothetical protein